MDKGKGRMREMEAEAALQPVRVTAANRDQAALLHQLHNLHASREHYQDLKDKLDILERRLDGLTVEPRWSVNVSRVACEMSNERQISYVGIGPLWPVGIHAWSARTHQYNHCTSWRRLLCRVQRISSSGCS